MEPAIEGLRDALRATPFADPGFPVVANANAELVDDQSTARDLLADQLTAPVRWVASMRVLHERWPEARWLELGPGSVLGGLLRRIIPDAVCTPLGTAEQVEEFLGR